MRCNTMQLRICAQTHTQLEHENEVAYSLIMDINGATCELWCHCSLTRWHMVRIRDFLFENHNNSDRMKFQLSVFHTTYFLIHMHISILWYMLYVIRISWWIYVIVTIAIAVTLYFCIVIAQLSSPYTHTHLKYNENRGKSKYPINLFIRNKGQRH